MKLRCAVATMVGLVGCVSAAMAPPAKAAVACVDGTVGPADRPGGFPFPWDTGDNGLPTCRRLRFGTLDEHDSRNDYTQILDTPTVSPLATNASGQVSWPLVDSYGDTIEILTRPRGADGNLLNYWTISDPSGTVVDSTENANIDGALFDSATGQPYSLPRIDVQGIGCMDPPSLSSTYALIAFQPKPRGSITHSRASIRAFIPQAALPPQFRAGGGSDDVMGHSTGCGGTRLSPATVFPVPLTNLHGYYLGRDASTQIGYGSYNALRGGAIPIMASTTAVKFGGIFRALAASGDQFQADDCFSYLDPNAAGGAPYVQWWFGEIIHGGALTGIYGYLPLRPPSGRPDPCPSGSPSGASASRLAMSSRRRRPRRARRRHAARVQPARHPRRHR